MRRLRKEQVVFVSKLEDGSTDVYSLYDYKDFRENMDAEKGYIQGRFDAVPFVDSIVLNLKQLLEDRFGKATERAKKLKIFENPSSGIFNLILAGSSPKPCVKEI